MGNQSVENNVFLECSSLVSIKIPKSVISIGQWAFYNCISLESLIFEDKNLFEYTGIISDYITGAKTKKKENIQKEKVERNIPRFTSSEKKEFDTIEEKIYNIEEEIENLKNETYTCGTDYQKLIDLNNQIEEKNILLNKMYERYEYLNNINDEIERYKREKYNG